jgi:hypothetical protein
MRLLIFLILSSWFVACGPNGGGNNGAEVALEEFELVIETELGEDHGQGLGTLFSARDSAGRVILEAGFQDSFSTNIRDNHRMLAFYCKDPNRPVKIEGIGKPFSQEVNAARLIVDKGVFAFYYDNPVQVDSNFGKAADWMPNGLFGVQYIGSKRLLMVNDPHVGPVLLFDDKIIYAPGENFLFYYNNGIVAIFHYNPDRVYIGLQDFALDRLIDLSKLKEFPVDGFPYIFGTYNDELIIGTTVGAVYSYKDEALRVVRQNDGTSFQIYSAIKVNNQLMLGHYPSGSIYIYDSNGLREFEHPIPVPPNADENNRETQTLCLFNGDLYAGIWPWGELWRFNFELKEWHFVDRLYYIPEMSSDLECPYEMEMIPVGGEFNYWGQRISSMTPFGDSLYISTMNKRGYPYDSVLHSFLSEEALDQYGQIYRLSGPHQITSPISWRNTTTFRFKISSGTMSIFQDGELLQEKEIPSLDCGCEKAESVVVGNGIFGSFGGAKIIDFQKLK